MTFPSRVFAHIQTAAPIQTVAAAGELHEFVPYTKPGLALTLACGFYLPRPLTCPVWLDNRQPPCLRFNPGTVHIQTSAPVQPVTLAASAHSVQIAHSQISVSVPTHAATLTGAAQQDLALAENGTAGVRAAHVQRNTATVTGLPIHYAQARPTRSATLAAQQQAIRTATAQTLPQTEMQHLHLASMLDHADGIRLPPAVARVAHTETLRQRSATRLPQTEAMRLRARTRAPHAEQIRTRNRRQISQQQGQKAAPRLLAFRTAHGRDTLTPLAVSQQQMMWPLPGRWWPWYEPPPLIIVLPCRPNYIPRPLRCMIVMCASQQPHCPGIDPDPAGVIIPVRRVYRVLNTVTLTRVSDGAEIPANSLSLSLSADAWTWSWSARVSGHALTLIRVDDEPVELLATINGQGIRLRIDAISRSRVFGSSLLDVRGRGRAAVLAAPTAPTLNFYNTEARDAQQLLIDALTDNGIPIGWEVDWQIEDWPVTAGAWSHSGAYIDAATRIAEAGGGYVHGHDTDQTLIIRPYYPVAPWEWAGTTPDIQMPEDVCQTEGIEWIEKANYNAVFVTGARRDYIRRAGSDGQIIAPTVVDALATDAIMTRQRGLRTLADTGKQAMIRVKLPVVSETGIIHPGNLIRYTEQGVTRLGMSRAVQVDCGFPEVWQTITMESR